MTPSPAPDDIVGRLRKEAEWEGGTGLSYLAEQAADEITRLRAEKADLEAALEWAKKEFSAAQTMADHNYALWVAEQTRAHADREKVASLEGERDTFEGEISGAIGGVRFMDPPDGGDVSLPEQVRRMRRALLEAEQNLEVYRTAEAARLVRSSSTGAA